MWLDAGGGVAMDLAEVPAPASPDLSGSVEIAPRLGRADLICDLVSTGSTLAANHLRHAETVLDSQAVLIRTPVPIAPVENTR